MLQDLRPIVDRVHRLTEPYAQDRGAHVDFRFTDQPCPVEVSSIEIEQALVNVLRNAIESREAGAFVEVELSVYDKTVQVDVIDDGRGIEAADLPKIRDPFYTTRLEMGGSGLGLSVAHGIIANHQGVLDIKSQSGEGTRVSIRLPRGG